MAKFGIFFIATFSVITFLNIYVSAGPIGDRSTSATTVAEGNTTITLLATTEIALVNETRVVDTLTTEIDVVGGNETHIRQKRSCGCCCCRPCCCCCRPCCCCCRCCCCRCCCCCCRCCCCRCCCCRPCCCGCGGCGCCGCGGGRKRRAIQELSHKLMNKNIAQFSAQQQFFDSTEVNQDATTPSQESDATTPSKTDSESDATTSKTTIAEGTTTTEASKIEATTMLTEFRKMTNAKIDSFGRRQF